MARFEVTDGVWEDSLFSIQLGRNKGTQRTPDCWGWMSFWLRLTLKTGDQTQPSFSFSSSRGKKREPGCQMDIESQFIIIQTKCTTLLISWVTILSGSIEWGWVKSLYQKHVLTHFFFYKWQRNYLLRGNYLGQTGCQMDIEIQFIIIQTKCTTLLISLVTILSGSVGSRWVKSLY